MLCILCSIWLCTYLFIIHGIGFDSVEYYGSTTVDHISDITGNNKNHFEILDKFGSSNHSYLNSHSSCHNNSISRHSSSQIHNESILNYFVHHHHEKQYFSLQQNCPNFDLVLKRIYEIYFDTTPSKCDNYVIYKCHNYCGGWGDRLVGIANVFLISLLSGRKFAIDHVPHDFHNYFSWHPIVESIFDTDFPTYDWTILQSNDQLHAKQCTSTVYSMIDKQFTPFIQQKFDETFYSSNYNYIQMNVRSFSAILEYGPFKQMGEQLQFKHVNSEKLFGCLMQLIMHPKGILKSSLNNLIKPDSVFCCGYVGIQIRTGGDGWNDPRRVDHSASDWFYQCAISLSSQVNKSQLKWYLTSDSESLLENAATRYPDRIILIPGKPFHIDRSVASDPIELSRSFFKTVLDFFVLANSEFNIISGSNFGMLATSWYFKPGLRFFTVNDSCNFSNVIFY